MMIETLIATPGLASPVIESILDQRIRTFRGVL